MSMRTLKRREQTIKHLKPTSTVGGMGSIVVSWTGKAAEIAASVQPLSSAHIKTEYGERAERMRAVILPNGTYAIGDGVWLAGETTATPPWLIISVGAWLDLTALVIEKAL